MLYFAEIEPPDVGIDMKATSPSIHSGTTSFSFIDFPNLENSQLVTLNPLTPSVASDFVNKLRRDTSSGFAFNLEL